MRFHCSDFYDYKGVPRPWIDYDLSPNGSMTKYFNDIMRIWDADICGDVEVDFVFDNGEAYSLEYSWWIDYDPEWDLKSDLSINAIDIDDAKCMKKYRDIMGKPHDARLNKYVASMVIMVT